MDIKEIRVGNRLRIAKEVEPEIEDACDVVFENNEVIVSSVHDNGDIQAWVNLAGGDNQIFDFSVGELEPLSLSLELLEEFGFVKNGLSEHVLKLGGFKIVLWFWGFWRLDIKGQFNKVQLTGSCKVHELQNIVFDTTKYELEFKNNDLKTEDMKKSKKIAEEVWSMLPDECKEIMRGVESSFKESVSADIETEYAPSNDTNTNR